MTGQMRCRVLICCGFGLLFSVFCAAQQKRKDGLTVTEALDRSIVHMEHEFVPAADAMPEDKFDFAPSNGEFKGVRTYGQQIKHVAAVNYEIGAAIMEQKPPTDIGDEDGPTSVKSKAQIMEYLKNSLAYVHKAVQTINEGNLTAQVRSPFGEGKVTRLALAQTILSHAFDHYGQMVVYLRMNGIIPPASR
ncbi:MAG TPA: DinB family protein [Candidatus Binatia bacterium]|nr:DinB family protein [Candidatus Binatia bacterium]